MHGSEKTIVIIEMHGVSIVYMHGVYLLYKYTLCMVDRPFIYIYIYIYDRYILYIYLLSPISM